MSSQTQQSESCYVIHFTKSHQILNSYFSTPMVVVIVFGIPGYVQQLLFNYILCVDVECFVDENLLGVVKPHSQET